MGRGGLVKEPEILWRMPGPERWQWCPLCAGPLGDRLLDGAPRRFCPDCGFVYWDHPRPAAAAVVTDHEGRILLVRRRFPPEAGGWCLPGGLAEAGEGPEEAARREVREETGLEVSVVRHLATLGHFVAFVEAESSGGALLAGSDVLDLGWFTPAEAPALCFVNHRRALELWGRR